MQRIILLRHPETTWNREGRFQGVMEGKISRKGFVQINKIKEIIKFYNFNIIFHADNKRTGLLANEINSVVKNNCELIMDSRLNERNMGIYEGKLRSEMKLQDIRSYDPKNYLNRFMWKPEKGESHEEMYYRLKEFINYLKIEHSKKIPLIITSKGVIRLMYYIIQNMNLKDMYELQIDNVSFHEMYV